MVSRRRVAWCDFLMDETLADTVVHLDNLLVNAPVSDTMTVIRIIGDFKVILPAAGETETRQNIDVGIGVINQEAFDLGTGVGIPNPTVEDSTPPRGWLYAARQPVLQSLPPGATPAAMWRESAHFKFDLRGQRKIDKGVLYMWLEMNVASGSTTQPIAVGRIRSLFKT